MFHHVKKQVVQKWTIPIVKGLTDTGENGTNRPVYFRLGAESYSSFEPVRKKEENSVSTFGRFRLWTSFEFSPRRACIG